MRRFLYYLPGIPGVNPQMLSDRGLVARFNNRGGSLIEFGVTGVTEGPDGKSGCIVAAGAQPPSLGDHQRWIEGGKFWVGIEDPNLPPGPSDLNRDVVIKGTELTLCDGNNWLAPLIRRWNRQKLEHESGVPKTMTMHHGLPVFRVSPDFAEVDAIADRIFAAFIVEQSLPGAVVFESCAAMMAVNYRIGIEEIGLLGLLDETKAVELLQAVIDAPTLRAHAVEMSVDGLRAIEPRIPEEEG